MRRINKDEEHLGKLRNFYARNNILPPYSTIGELTGMTAPAAFQMVTRLKKKGYLESLGRQLQPGPRFFESVLVDTVQAGRPAPANDIQPVGIDIIRRLLKSPLRSVLMRVNGDSMVDAGLLDGDYVVVQRGAQAKAGDIVVAQIDREYTVKHLQKGVNGPYLKAANKRYSDIRPKEGLEIYGVVTGSFRSYNPRYAR